MIRPFFITIDDDLSVLLMVELIVSILIIGICAAIAIPIYTSYIQKTKVSEAIVLMGNTKSQMVEYYSIIGHLPTKTEQLLGAKTAGRYTTNITVDNGTITTTMRYNNLSLSLRPAYPPNKKLPKVIVYVCGYAAPPNHFIVQGKNNTNIPLHYLSFTCK
jgi:Tfp pilus assembly protein PilE